MSESEERESTSREDKDGALVCPTCGTQTLRRTGRKGFMQRAIYSSFGYFPWKCSGCKALQLMKNRGSRRRRRRAEDE